MNMLHDECVDRVLGVLKRCVDTTPEMLDPRNWDKPLTGNLYHFTDVDMIYLLFELELEFGIRINQDVFDNYGFSTIEKIVSAIEKT